LNTVREKREDERRKLRQPELGNDSPLQQQQQIAQNSISSTLINTTTTVVQQDSKKINLSWSFSSID
jgi:hypothetical protein